MKLIPQQAPLYGRCMITVQLTDDELAMDEVGAAATACNYFLLFAGSTQRHLSSTLRSGHDTLQALCPAHGCCEEVLVTLCAVTRGDTETFEEPTTLSSHVTPLAEQHFTFLQDLAFDMAQFLVSTVGRTDGLDGALLLDECHIPLMECERLDESLALALHHIPLPPGWNLLGNQCSDGADLHPRETLLHFSARRGLVRVTRFLLQQPGARDAVRLPNKQGQTPAAVAALRGHASLQQLLAQAETDGDIDQGPQCVQPVPTDARVVCREPGLHTLTQSVYPGRDPPSLSQSVDQLLHLTSHLHAKRASVLELRSDCLHTADECSEGIETETTGCPRANALGNSVGNGTSVTCGCDDKEDWSVSVVHPGEPGLTPPEDWVCLESKSVEGQEQPDTAENLSLCERQEGGSPPPVESLPPAGRSEQKTDREEGQEATEGEDLSGKEVNGISQSTEEESSGEFVMGQSPSSDAPVRESHQDGEDLTHDSDHSNGPFLNEEEVENEALAQENLPPPAVSDDVILESDVPPHVEEEPPPDVNNSEQNQETAGRDHTGEWQQDPDQQTTCRETCSELNATENVDQAFIAGRETPEETECSPEHKFDVDPDSGVTHGLSSDDDVSFQSVGSCVTDVFHPTEESILLEEKEPTEEINVGEADNMTPNQSGTCSPTSLEPTTGSEETTINLESGFHTEERPEGTEELVCVEPSESDLSPGKDASAESVEDENSNRDDQSEEVQVIMSEQAGTSCAAEELDETDSSVIQRDAEASFQQPRNAQHLGTSRSATLPALSSRTVSSNSCSSTTHRDSSSDIESLLSAENDEPVTCGDSTSEVSISCSSTDDTASVGLSSSSPEGSQGLGSSGWSPEEGALREASTSTADGGAGVAGDAEEEAKDRVTEVPRRSSLVRGSLRSLSPLRRHSWGPGKNNGGGPAMNQRSRKGKLTIHRRSYSLEGLSGGQEEARRPASQGPRILEPSRMLRHDVDERGSLVSLTEEQEEAGPPCGLEKQSRRYRPLKNNCPPMTLPLTKSVSMLAISHRDIDVVGRLRRRRRISFSFSLSPILTKSKSHSLYGDSSTSDDDDNFSMRSFSSTSGSLAYSISEEEPGSQRSDAEAGKGGTKVSRTFSYLKNKMYKKNREKERDKKEKEAKEKEKKAINGHHFAATGSGQVPTSTLCSQCNKALGGKEIFQCTYCNSCVHKGCRDGLAVCAKVKMKLPRQQFSTVPDSSSFPGVTMRNKTCGTRERPWSAILSPEDHVSQTMQPSRRHTSLMPFHGNNLSKSLSISNIAGPVFDEIPIRGLRYLSQSTDSLNRTNAVTESMESLTDEGHYTPSQPWTEMMDGQLMGEFEGEAKEMEADSWSLGVEQQYLQQLDRNLVKRQDVIYELMQTEIHHFRTLRIMSEVYSKGLQKELQLEPQILERLFPALDELLDFHTQLLLRMLERKRDSLPEGGRSEQGVVVHRIGDILLSQFSGCNSESMKSTYGKFCSRHNEAVNLYKDLLTKDKRFKAFIKKKMSSSIVRRLGIPECILLVTQRITKYPVLIQRILQHTTEGDADYDDLSESLRLVKEAIAGVDGRVNEHDKKRRLKDFHSRTDSKSIMMMKSGQIFAREDLLRRRLVHDGALQLKSNQGRLKDVHALLLSDVLVFLQEKDQKYLFAMLDQRSTVISLQKLIVREVANEERGLFLITAGIEKPEMMEVLASSKEERNAWMQLIQDAMQSMERDEDEGIPSETEDDKRQLEIKAKEMRELMKQKDSEIMSLLEEKVRLFRGMCEGFGPVEEPCRQTEPFFRSSGGPEPPRGARIMKDALQEVETLQTLVNSSLGGAMAGVQDGVGAPGSGCLPRRAETFGGFDSHQMQLSKSGDKDESEEATRDLRRTESDSVLKKGGNANLLQLLKRNSEQVLHSVSNLHFLLSTLQAVVVQQDSFIEDQRQALSERSPLACSSRPSSRPSSLIEQEKQRSLEKQRQDLAALQRQQAAHADERRRREKEFELRERLLGDREALLNVQEEELSKQQRALDDERRELASRKGDYQRDLERLRDAQRKLDKDREALQRQLDKMDELRRAERTPSTASDESQLAGSCQSLDLETLDAFSSSSSSSSSQRCKAKTRGLNPFMSSSSSSSSSVVKTGETNKQLSKSLLQLAKNRGKEGKDKRKKKVKGQAADSQQLPDAPLDGEIFFC
ncbi:A-kinase anchor protein 13 isoform X2 [Corythoichthys intestinalis]|uniref:A-kinase anchor protein 13 isoform X2 n=1 Tax=Corythoichthys intestinalis TaxID=161448 RepID=UPI0025A4FBBB|nr:A-kinase anchor protein 13-like isoform X2 [Corythoichthys intestinalis]